MLVTMKEMLADAKKNHYAIPAFDVSNYEMMKAVLETCEEEKSPALLMTLGVDTEGRNLQLLSSMINGASNYFKIPICLHMDHATDIDFIKYGCDNGYSSVMYDGSVLSFDENARNTAIVTEYAHRKGITVEAELGHVGNASVGSISETGTDTDPGESLTVPAVVELGDAILGFDGCLNFFAGPLDKKFSANFNFYNVHYAQHHVTGTSGSTPEDMRDIVNLIGENRLDPSVMITHIGGIDAAIDTTVNLPNITGGKKLIYTHIELALTALSDFEKLGETDERFKVLDELVKTNNGLWCTEAEKYLLQNF